MSDRLAGDLTDISGVTSIERLDGVKLNLADDAWLLFRASGTEPVLRIYCEAATEEAVRNTLKAAEDWVRQTVS